ncbi:MAG: right-handed parallel beta-helix repeat-containing protein [Actinomycetota bacterium]
MVEDDTVVVEGHLVVESGASLTLSGVTLQLGAGAREYAAILVQPGGALDIQDCQILPLEPDTAYQFYIDGGDLVMKRSLISAAGLPTSSGWSLMGISLFGCEGSVIEGNTIRQRWGAGSALTLDACRDVHVTGNTVTVEPWGYFGLAVRQSQLCSITRNTVSGQNEAIFLQQNTWGNMVSDNTVTGAGTCVVVRHGVGYNTIARNVLTSSGMGLYLQQAPYPDLIEDNTIEAMRNGGMFLEYATGTIVSGNKISDIGVGRDLSLTGGLSLHRCRDATIVDNTITGSASGGIMLFSSSGSRIAGNTVSDAGEGLGLYFDSDSSEVTGNWILGCDRPVAVRTCAGNVLSGNALDEQGLAPMDEGANRWAGNYWSQHASTWGEVGAAVVPYFVAPRGVDLQPLGRRPDLWGSGDPVWNPPSTFPNLNEPEDPMAAQWPLTTTLVWSDTTVQYRWDKLFIGAGGHLVLQRATLVGASPWTAEPAIVVDDGGVLEVVDSQISGGVWDCPLAILVWPGGRCDIRGSILADLGGEGGVRLLGTGSVLEGNRFVKCYGPIEVGGQNNRVVGNTLDRCRYGIEGNRAANEVYNNNDEALTVSAGADPGPVEYSWNAAWLGVGESSV